MRKEQRVITFTNEKERGIHHPHIDTLVSTMTKANNKVHSILRNNRISIGILYLITFNKLGISRDHLKPTVITSLGFMGENVSLKGIIQLLMIIGESSNQVALMVDFLVINCPSIYNIIIGCPTPNPIRLIALMFHMMMTFPTINGVKFLRGE